MVPDIPDTRYLLYPILMIPNISDISDVWIYSLCLTGATTMPRAPFLNNSLKNYLFPKVGFSEGVDTLVFASLYSLFYTE